MEAIKKEEIELLKKINTLRKEVKDTLTKSGKNDFSHFTYFQLKDFIPTVVDKCAEKQELFIYFNIDKEKVELPKKVTSTIGESAATITEENFEYREYAYLTIIDLSSGISKVYKKETKEALVKGASDIQNLGAKSTYMKRYLYMDLLEIAEDDTVDVNDKTNNNNSSPAQVSTPPTPKVETKKVETKKAVTTEASKPVENIATGNELMSLADKDEITKFIIENKLEAKVIVDIAKELGYASPVELRAKDKEAVMTAIKEKVGK